MIPLSVPNIDADDLAAVNDALASGWISSAGPEVRQFEEVLRELTGSPFVVATNSGTSALHLGLLTLDLQPGERVLVSNLTYVATVNPIRYAGGEPVFIDAHPGDWQMDADLVEQYLTEETDRIDGHCIERASGQRIRAILVTHVLGHAAPVDRLVNLAAEYGLELMEDAAEALGSEVAGRHPGTIGTLGALSFNGNKIVSCGAGGALLLQDPARAERARVLAAQAKRHPDEYIHDEVGYNYGLSNLSAALGRSQTKRLPAFLQRKNEIAAFYRDQLKDLNDITFIQDQPDSHPNYWLSAIHSSSARMLEEVLFLNGVQTRKLWLPMNRLPMFRDHRYITRDDHSYSIYEGSLCLPSSTGISDADLQTVVNAIRQFFG